MQWGCKIYNECTIIQWDYNNTMRVQKIQWELISTMIVH